MSKKKKIGRGARLVLALRKFDAWFMGRNYYFRALVVIGAMAGIFILGALSLLQWMGYLIESVYLEMSALRAFVLVVWMVWSASLLMFGAIGTLTQTAEVPFRKVGDECVTKRFIYSENN
jgi:hypothetical protein